MRSRLLSLASVVLLTPLSVMAALPATALARVSDEGKFFSADAIKKADAKIEQIDRNDRKDLLIATVAKVPDQLQAKFKEMGKKEFFNDWARKRAEDAKVKGIYILLCMEPAHVQVEMDRATRAKAFTSEDRDRLLKKIVPLLREKKNDAALSETVDFIALTLRANVGRHGAAAGGVRTSPHRTAGELSPGAINAERTEPHQAVSPWLWVGVIAVVLLGGWVLMQIVRAMAGGGGLGGGGGGGGFLTSLLGGMFGAAAGMWIYDSFFRGDSQAFGGPTEPGDTGAGDFGGDSGGGADFGNDSGGGDFGGGDFGGGDFGD